MVNPFSKLGDLSNLMQQAKGMQQKMQQAQEDLARTQVIGEAGGGLVQIITNGNGDALGVDIKDVVLQEGDKRILQGLIMAAINDANHKREVKKKEIMSGIMSGMGLPPDLELFNKSGE